MNDPWPDTATITLLDSFGLAAEIHLPQSPVSAQAKSKPKKALKKALTQLTETAEWVFTGDVSVTIEWTVDRVWRHENHKVPDLDNIVKPVLDGLVGPSGIILDDTQVSHLEVYWISWTRTDRQHLKITIDALDPSDRIDRPFSVVEVRPALCQILPADLDASARAVLCDAISAAWDANDRLESLGVVRSTARHVVPMGRVIHRNKLSEFPVLALEDYRSQPD